MRYPSQNNKLFIFGLTIPLSLCCITIIGTLMIMIVKAIKLTSLIIPIIMYSCATADVKNVKNRESALWVFLLRNG